MHCEGISRKKVLRKVGNTKWQQKDDLTWRDSIHKYLSSSFLQNKRCSLLKTRNLLPKIWISWAFDKFYWRRTRYLSSGIWNFLFDDG